MTFKLAHFSDTHVLSLKDASLDDFLNKRLSGAVNLVLNRGRHYRTEVFEAVLDAIAAEKPDHVVCTGDLVNLALQAEFEKVKSLLAKTFDPGQLTLIPGNHDYYVKEAMTLGHFERIFAEYLPSTIEERYPFVKDLGPIAIFGLCSAIEQPVFFAGGRLGPEQLRRWETLAQASAFAEKFRIVLVHHPLLPDPERKFEFTRRLEDAEAFIESLWRLGESSPHLVLNGHNHRYRRSVLPGTTVVNVQAASASRFGGRHPAEFNLYEIDRTQLLQIERRIFDGETGRFRRVVAFEADTRMRTA